MLCPKCGSSDHQVIDSGSRSKGRKIGRGYRCNQIKRRRRCMSCQHRWSTVEALVETMDNYRRARKTALHTIQRYLQRVERLLQEEV